MAQLLVRQLDDGVKARLRARAAARGRSMEEARVVLAAALLGTARADDGPGLGTRIARRFAGQGLDLSTEEVRGAPVRPASFDGAP